MVPLEKGSSVSSKDLDFDAFWIQDIIIGQLGDHLIDFNSSEPDFLVKPVDQHIRNTGQAKAQNQAGPYRMFIPSQSLKRFSEVGVQVAVTVDRSIRQQFVTAPVQDDIEFRI
jgi:hypothetical protein